MIRVTLVCLLCTNIFLLSGCWDRIELNDIAIVTAAAIDLKEDQQIELSVQIFIPRAQGSGGGMGGGGVGSGGTSTLVKSAIGVNLADAASKIQGKLARNLFWGHCNVFIFGQKKAEQGIRDEIDFLLRHPMPRGTANTYVSKEMGLKIMTQSPLLERFSGEVLRGMAKTENAMSVTISDLSHVLKSKSKTAVIPMIDLMPASQGANTKEKAPFIIGTAIFKEDKMVGQLSVSTSRGLLLLKDKAKKYVATVKLKDAPGLVSIELSKTDVKIIPKVMNGEWNALVKIKTAGEITQNGTKLNLNFPKAVREVEHALKEDIRNRIELTLKQIQHEMKADVIDLAQAFYRKYPKEWKKSQHRWDEVFAEVKVKIEIETLIRGPGFLLAPAGLPPDEVKMK